MFGIKSKMVHIIGIRSQRRWFGSWIKVLIQSWSKHNCLPFLTYRLRHLKNSDLCPILNIFHTHTRVVPVN